ncbi:hypothetical protein C2S52_014374 [Perilla frutescens var. hirtella]|nr:hypothetical protein C2S52_014374 [Perilla frutescens var. hirtella]
MPSNGGNSDTSMVGVDFNSRTRPYYSRRCKRVRSTNIESLPDELLFHILVRLPADHLYDRARFVCRKWYHIIHSSAFINTHVQHSTYGLMLSVESYSSGRPIFVSATAQGQIETSEFSYKCRVRILGSCNGLGWECQVTYRNVPHIINPATKQVFMLPPLSSEMLRASKSGIAYVAASMEYKVILPHLEVISRTSLPVLAILTVGVDNSWRHLPVETLPERARERLFQYPLITEGFIHWVRGTDVLTLDVETEVFISRKVSLPLSYQEKRKYYLSTGKYLSLVVARGDFLWGVWWMEPETGEWRKLRPDINFEAQKTRLEQFSCGDEDYEEDLVPLGWVKYPEVLALCFRGRGHTCIFYNLDTHEISSTELPETSRAYAAFPHKNNLIWLS